MADTRIAFYGGSFDPPHIGHLAVAEGLIKQFRLDEFVFIPAFHAPHKKRKKPTPAYDRYAMLCLATQNDAEISVSRIEIEVPERPYTVETLAKLVDMLPRVEIFFVMGSDSWNEITTWREWETVLELTNHIVVTRPGYELETDHVTEEIADRIIDLRGSSETNEATLAAILQDRKNKFTQPAIYFTDCVKLDVSSTVIRNAIRAGKSDWDKELLPEVANYIGKYQIY